MKSLSDETLLKMYELYQSYRINPPETLKD